jgi:hypothetical protein
LFGLKDRIISGGYTYDSQAMETREFHNFPYVASNSQAIQPATRGICHPNVSK